MDMTLEEAYAASQATLAEVVNDNIGLRMQVQILASRVNEREQRLAELEGEQGHSHDDDKTSPSDFEAADAAAKRAEAIARRDARKEGDAD